MTDRSAPKTQLKLEWVYGYRGHQCRNNLYYLNSTDEVVYFVAGLAVVYNKHQQKQRFYLGHDDDIVSLALHPDGQTVATGQVGKKPYICVWDSSNLQTLSILKDVHSHGIASVSFNDNGERLASVGLDSSSTLAVWHWKSGRSLSTAKGHTDRVFDIAWEVGSDNKLVTCGVKHIKFWTLCGNSLSHKRGVFGKTGELQTILCVCAWRGSVTFSGTMSGDVYKWRENNLERTIPHAHSGAIFSMHKSADGFATGGRDGVIKLWDVDFNPLTTLDMNIKPLESEGISIRSVCWRGDKILAGTHDSEVFEVEVRDRENPLPLTQGHGEGELWGLCVNGGTIATCGDDCSVRLWSVVDHVMIAYCCLQQPCRSCSFSPDGEFLAVGCKDGSFTVLRIRDMDEVVTIKHRKEVVHEMKYSPDGNFLAVASNDNFVDVYSTKQNYKKVGYCAKSSSFITHIDWSRDCHYLQTNDGAGERLVYIMPSGQQLLDADAMSTIKWSTWTSVLGPEVNGIWPKYTSINDVNSVDACFNRHVCATGDDFGLVKLFNFPSIRKGAKFRRYVGHSAHVTNVRFTSDSKWLISTGGADHAVFQWRVLGEGDHLDHNSHNQEEVQAESVTEGSDSDMSDVAEVDSDIEHEAQLSYEREVYKSDLKKLKSSLKGAENKSNGKRRSKSLPQSSSLKLQYVFGYRSYDCRDNLFYTQKDDIVYHVAAVAVILNRDTGRMKFYNKHDDDILCLNLHPHKDIAATGQVGKDAVIHIWDIENLKTLSILQGFHQRGVCTLDFSGDGRKLVSIGLDNDHSVALWDWKKGVKLATSNGHKDKIFMIRFDPIDSNKLVTVGVKHIKFWQHVGGGMTSQRGVFGNAGKLDSMLCVAYGNQGNVYSGAANGQVYIWKGRTLERTVKTHDGPCFAIHALDKGFVTGGKDGVVCLWSGDFERNLKSYPIVSSSLAPDTKGKLVEDNPTVRAINLGNSKILIGTKNSEVLEIEKNGPINLLVQGHGEGEIWGIACHPNRFHVATVSDDKTLRTWSIFQPLNGSGGPQMLNVKKMKVGGRCCAYSPDGNAIAVGRNDGSFIVANASNLEELVHFHHRKEAISDIRFSPNGGKYLAVASHDNFVDIYNVHNSKRVGICKGASSYITHIDWDSTGKLLIVNSGAKELLYFEAPRGKRQTIASDDVIEWQSWTGVLGKSCEGIWPPYSDVTDVNSSCLNKRRGLLATGDDMGLVKLFVYPCKGKHQKFKKYLGHSSHVTNVRWSHDGTSLVSLGGADTSIMVWSCNDICVNGASAKSVSYHGESEDSDTDSEEEGGYDSDVAREKNMDYSAKTYAKSIREGKGVKPTSQSYNESKFDKQKVSRSIPKGERVKRHNNFVTQDHVTDLQLEHIFGYRGFDCRDNLYYIADGTKIVYHAAGAGIVYDVQSGQQKFYLEHTDDIISLTVNQHHKYQNVVATGQLGNNSYIHVWDGISRNTVSILKGVHTSGVCYLNFSSSGKLLLSVGVDQEHTVAIWRWSEGSRVCSHVTGNKRIFAAQFRPDSDIHFVTVGVKHVCFWQVCGSAMLSKRGVLGATEGIKAQTMLSIAFGADDLTFTGAMNGDVYVWKRHVLARTVARAHAGPVFTLYTTLRDGLIVSGGKEKLTKDGGVVKLWDQDMRRCRAFQINDTNVVKSVSRHKGKILVGTRDSEVKEISEKNGASITLVHGHGEGELWGLATHPTQNICVTSSDDKTARIWDLNDKMMMRRISLPCGSRACCFSNSGELICVGLNNGELMLIDVVAVKVVAKKRDRSTKILDVRFRPDDRMLAVAYDEEVIYFYEITENRQLMKIGVCKQLPSTPFQLDFSNDGKLIQTSTNSYEKLMYHVPSGQKVEDNSKYKNVTWNSWTSTLGEEVIGIWPKNSDVGDVNSCDVTGSASCVATGDDFGLVKLFNFPCKDKYSKHKKYIGHSAHVTSVRFTKDDSKLISTGGDDCCVFVWKTE